MAFYPDILFSPASFEIFFQEMTFDSRQTQKKKKDNNKALVCVYALWNFVI